MRTEPHVNRAEGNNVSKPLEGVRVLEVAAWTFVPAAGAILSDLGAEVIKVESNSNLDEMRAYGTRWLLGC